MAKGGKIEYCKVADCGKRCVGWGYCSLHYGRLKRLGDWKPTHRSQARAETIAEDGSRLCFKCNTRKPFTAEFFGADYRRPGELKGTCKECLHRASRRVHFRLRYGTSLEDIEQMQLAQDNRCAICLQIFSAKGRVSKSTRQAHVDHDHVTGEVRGLLCHHCNVLLGHAKDRPELLHAAIGYLERKNANH